MGVKQSVAATALPSTYPALFNDKVITPGHLVLIDFTNTADPVTGVPANGARIPNLARKQAARLINADTPGTYNGSSDLSGLDCSIEVGTSMQTAGKGKLERSAKGGLHGIVSVSGADNQTFARIKLPTAIKAYIVAHMNSGASLDQIGFFAEMAFTRAGNTGRIVSMLGVSSGSGAYFMYSPGDAISGSLGSTQNPAYNNVPADPTVSLMPTLRAISTKTLPGTPTGSSLIAQMGWGDNGTASGASSATANFPSYVLYRLHLVDLTKVQAGGIPYADMVALITDQWQRHTTVYNGVTGKYYGDTVPTNPSTIP